MITVAADPLSAYLCGAVLTAQVKSDRFGDRRKKKFLKSHELSSIITSFLMGALWSKMAGGLISILEEIEID